MRVLIVKLSSLGDVVHAMPVVHDIRTALPGAQIDWVVEPGFAPLVRRVEGVAEVIECALRRWSAQWWTGATRAEWRAFRVRLRRERYDAVLDLQGLTKSALVARLATLTSRGLRYGLANRTDGAGFEPPARWLVDRAIRIEPRTHALDRSRLLAARALGYTADGPPRFGLRAAAVPRVGPPTLVLVHGSSRDDKLWPEASWIEFGRRARAEGWRLALPHAGAAELARAQRIAAALDDGSGAAVEVWPAMNLDALVDRLGATQGVVGVDSGLSHIAVALDLPHVQLYNWPTAWRTGPQAAHGHRHQVSVQAEPTPPVDAVWAAWTQVRGATGLKTLREALARAAYALLLRLLQPAYALRLWRRGAAEPLYRKRLAERFGFYREPFGAGSVWVHAVSLGETRAAAPLVEALRAERPGLRLLLTHGTATGREAGRALLRDGDRQTWLPYDTPGATARFFAQFRPAVGVLMETEVWPNLLLAAQAAQVPMVLANARLSERSLARGRRLDAVLRPAIDSVALVLAQSDDDAQRLRAAGARAVEVSGNLKYDLTPEPEQLAQGAAWRALLARDVVLAAITREGEEALLLATWARDAPLGALLLIVPRHPQRFDEVAALVRAAGLTLARRSTWGETPPPDALQAQVWLGDSMREMALYYASAQVALLGGSFAPLGGHNLIEAAACGCPLVMGPSTFNFGEAAELSLAAGASLRVADMAAGVRLANELLGTPQRLAELSANGLRFASRHRGAARRMAQRIVPLLRG